MYGKEKTIKFVQQAPSEKIENSEFDIKNDTLKIYRLAEFDDTQITNLIEKVQKKIMSREMEYFSSQERVISLFDALNAWGLCSKQQKEILLEIAKGFASAEKLLHHNSEKWHDYDYRGDTGCPRETFKFLSAVNKYNEEIFSTDIIDIKQATEIDVIKSYEYQYDIDEEKFELILNKLIHEVGSKEADGKYIWKSICRIACNNMVVAKSVIKKKLATCIDIVEKIRLKELYEYCEETEFYLEQEQEYMRNQELYGNV